jgi:vitamin K-dependent gamma-carboxylase
MLIATIRFVAMGSVAEYYVEPTHFFHYAGFGWVQPWPGMGMYVHFAVLMLLAVGIIVPRTTRVASALFGAGFAYAHFIDKTNYLNHYYLVICASFVLAVLPRGTQVPRWVLGAVRAQVGLVYVFGGIAKLQADWLFDAQPLAIWLPANSDFPLLGPLFEHKWVAYVFAWAGAAFDLCIVPLLLWHRSRPFAYALVVVFHVITARLFNLGMFPWIMIASSLIFLPPEWPRRIAPRFSALLVRDRSSPSRLVPYVLAAYFAIQIVVPLRHHVIPGNVLWTEEGFRFAWHVMVMEKDGSVVFHVEDPATNRRWDVRPGEYLTRYQTKMMAAQPDMILELAHVIANDFRARGVAEPRVTADAFASLNGRSRARMIDPDVDLARARETAGHDAWILPGKGSL